MSVQTDRFALFHTLTHTYTLTRTSTNAQTHTQTNWSGSDPVWLAQSWLWKFVFTCQQVHREWTHTHTYIHTHTHTHTHLHTHTQHWRYEQRRRLPEHSLTGTGVNLGVSALTFRRERQTDARARRDIHTYIRKHTYRCALAVRTITQMHTFARKNALTHRCTEIDTLNKRGGCSLMGQHFTSNQKWQVRFPPYDVSNKFVC